MQAPVPVHAPVHPKNVEPALGVAVSVTAVPCLKLAEHVGWQAIPEGLLDTEPSPDPASPMASVKVGTAEPVPARLAFWVLSATPLELSVTVRAASSAPVVEGVKIIEMVQEVLGANCPPAVLQVSPEPSEKSDALLPVNV